jgi:hypothetical protein
LVHIQHTCDQHSTSILTTNTGDWFLEN